MTIKEQFVSKQRLIMKTNTARPIIFFIALLSGTAFVKTACAGILLGLGSLYEGGTSSGGGISGDGKTIVGSSGNSTEQKSILWTVDAGIRSFDAPGRSGAIAISRDASTIVGVANQVIANNVLVESNAYYRNRNGTVTTFTNQPVSYFNDVSADGSAIVGRVRVQGGGTRAVSYATASGFELLETPGAYSWANAISDDGTKIVGTGGGGSTPISEALLWQKGSGVLRLGDLPGGAGFYPGGQFSNAFDISGDGSVVVGSSESNLGIEAYRWTPDTGMVGLGFLDGQNISVALATNLDGSIIVGSGRTGLDSAFVWDAQNGMRKISDLVNSVGWILEGASGVSDDGTKIVGYGTNPSGIREGWYVDVTAVPEPSTIFTSLLAFFSIAFPASFSKKRTETIAD
jgi:probable HAF family extracellular repeat protein